VWYLKVDLLAKRKAITYNCNWQEQQGTSEEEFQTTRPWIRGKKTSMESWWQ